jgi:hypothetical protein
MGAKLYFPWICCEGCNLFSICVINWIGIQMICCHRSITRRKKENKEGGKKRWKKKWFNLWSVHQCLHKLVANWNGQDFSNHTSYSQQF